MQNVHSTVYSAEFVKVEVDVVVEVADPAAAALDIIALFFFTRQGGRY